jgi:hypothetical protein
VRACLCVRGHACVCVRAWSHWPTTGCGETGQIADWTLEWTPNGYAGVKYWGKHYDELQAKGARSISLFASPRESMSQIKLSPPASPVLPRGTIALRNAEVQLSNVCEQIVELQAKQSASG